MFEGTDFDGFPATLAFYGLRYTGGVDDYEDADVMSRTYNEPQIVLEMGGYSIDTVAPSSGGVPEPGAWALMIAGFGLAGAALRRRRLPAAA